MWIPKGAAFIWGPALIRGNTVFSFSKKYEIIFSLEGQYISKFDISLIASTQLKLLRYEELQQLTSCFVTLNY